MWLQIFWEFQRGEIDKWDQDEQIDKYDEDELKGVVGLSYLKEGEGIEYYNTKREELEDCNE